MVGKVVTKTGETVLSQGMLYKAVVQCVFLFGSKIWMMTGAMIKVLEVFHHWLARRIAVMTAERTTIG